MKISAAFLFFAASIGSAFGQSAPSQPVVFDSNNKLVGPTTAFGFVLIQIKGKFYEVLTNSTGFSRVGFEYYYNTTDCTGQAYLRSQSDLVDFASVTGTSNNLLAIPDRSSSIQNAKSNKLVALGGTSFQCNSFPALGTFYKAGYYPVAQLGFVPPFRITLK